MKYVAQRNCKIEALEPFLAPVEAFGLEKHRKGQYDDWNEAAHTRKWLEDVLPAMKENDRLLVYYLEKEGAIIGSVFILCAQGILAKTLPEQKIGVDAAQLTCFHVVEGYRGCGVGRAFLEREVFPDLVDMGIRTLYIRSSHYKAIPLYEQLGKVVGNYISVSDHKLYRRYGYIFEVPMKG